MQSEDKALDNEEGIQLEDEPGLLEERTDDTVVNTEEEDKKGEEERMEEEEATTAEEDNRERDSEQNQDDQVSLTLYHPKHLKGGVFFFFKLKCILSEFNMQTAIS